MKKALNSCCLLVAMATVSGVGAQAQESKKQYPKQMEMKPQMSEYWEPQPAAVATSEATSNALRPAPSDATVLFDGKDLCKWQKPDG